MPLTYPIRKVGFPPPYLAKHRQTAKTLFLITIFGIHTYSFYQLYKNKHKTPTNNPQIYIYLYLKAKDRKKAKERNEIVTCLKMKRIACVSSP